jgi:chemotaxis protein CheD
MIETTTVLTHYLFPGTLYVNSRPSVVTTVLGSCVAVCLFDQEHYFGGINHFMLPYWNGDGLASPKYGNVAIKKLLEKMILLGADKKNLIAKIFGGGEVIDTTMANFYIGERNIELAFQYMQDVQIPVVSSCVGGLYGRKIIYSTNTGVIQHSFIDREVRQ